MLNKPLTADLDRTQSPASNSSQTVIPSFNLQNNTVAHVHQWQFQIADPKTVYL